MLLHISSRAAERDLVIHTRKFMETEYQAEPFSRTLKVSGKTAPIARPIRNPFTTLLVPASKVSTSSFSANSREAERRISSQSEKTCNAAKAKIATKN
jgi:hypothetical protein